MFDAKAFLLDRFGSPDGVLGLLGKHWDAIPQREAVCKWFSRGSIASAWWPILLLVLEIEDGRTVELKPYFASRELNGDIFS